jgi:hypothetical protein
VISRKKDLQKIIVRVVTFYARMPDKSENNHLSAELDTILDLYNKARTKHSSKASEEKVQEFLTKFERTKVQVIRPMMERIGRYMEKKGHAYQIKDEVSLYSDNPSIRMEIYPRSSDRSGVQEHEFPRITFIAEPDIDEVGIEVQDGMPGRPGLTRGHAAELDSLTEEYVKSQIVYLIKRNFARMAV